MLALESVDQDEKGNMNASGSDIVSYLFFKQHGLKEELLKSHKAKITNSYNDGLKQLIGISYTPIKQVDKPIDVVALAKRNN